MKHIKKIELEMVNNQHNKFYIMSLNALNDKKFTVKYGKRGTGGTVIQYPINKWYTILDSKLKKGYVVKNEEYFTEGDNKLQQDKFKLILEKIDKLIDILNIKKLDPLFDDQLMDLLVEHDSVVTIRENLNDSKKDYYRRFS